MSKSVSKSKLAKDSVYEDLRRRIISGELASDFHLVEKDLVETYNVSRTPVREALRQLVSDKLVRMIPKVGAFVGGLSWDDANEVFMIRSLLEAFAAQLAAERMTDEQINEVEKMVQDFSKAAELDDIESYISLDEKLHMYLTENCGNKHLVDLIYRVNDQTALISLRRSNFNVKSRMMTSLQGHEEIVTAIKNREIDRVGRLVWNHSLSFFDILTAARTWPGAAFWTPVQEN